MPNNRKIRLKMQPAGISTFLTSHDQTCPLASSFCCGAPLGRPPKRAGHEWRELSDGYTAEWSHCSGLVDRPVALQNFTGGPCSPNIQQRVNFSHSLPPGSNLATLQPIFTQHPERSLQNTSGVMPLFCRCVFNVPHTENKTPNPDQDFGLVPITSYFPITSSIAYHLPTVSLCPNLTASYFSKPPGMPLLKAFAHLFPLPRMLFPQMPSGLPPHFIYILVECHLIIREVLSLPQLYSFPITLSFLK